MKRLIFILVFFPLLTQAQWNYTYGNDTTNQEGYSIVYTSDGNYAIGGTTIWEGEKAMYLIKVNEYGEKLWQKIFNQQGNVSEFTKVKLRTTSDKGFIFGGDKFIKVDSNGIVQWMNTDFYDNCRDIYEAKNKIHLYLPNLQSEPIYCLDSTGNFMYDTWGSLYWITGGIRERDAMCETKDGDYIVIGQTEHGNSSTGYSYDHHVSFIKTQENSFITTSSTHNQITTCQVVNSTVDNGLIIINYSNEICFRDSSGNLLWCKPHQPTNHIEQTHDNGFISIGSGVIRTDENGDTLWTRMDIDGQEIHQINDSSFVLVRTDIDTITGDKNINIIKLTDQGQIAAYFFIPEPEEPQITNNKLINIIDFTGRQTKEKPNLPLIYIYENGTTEKKMIIE